MVKNCKHKATDLGDCYCVDLLRAPGWSWSALTVHQGTPGCSLRHVFVKPPQLLTKGCKRAVEMASRGRKMAGFLPLLAGRGRAGGGGGGGMVARPKV